MAASDNEFLKALDSVTYRAVPAWVPPDWPEGDPRWPLIDEQFRRMDRENALRSMHLAAIEDYVRRCDRKGVPHDAIAESLEWPVEVVEKLLANEFGPAWYGDVIPEDLWRWRREELPTPTPDLMP